MAAFELERDGLDSAWPAGVEVDEEQQAEVVAQAAVDGVVVDEAAEVVEDAAGDAVEDVRGMSRHELAPAATSAAAASRTSASG